MNINELQLGNLVYMGKITEYPTEVVGLFEDIVYIDFDNHEGIGLKLRQMTRNQYKRFGLR